MKKLVLLLILIPFFLTSLSGQKLPDFSLVTINGDTVISKKLLGKPIYINIWETYCAPCIDEIPTLNKLKEEHPTITFLSLTPASKGKVINFLKNHPIGFSVVCQADNVTKKLLKGGYPTHVFVDSIGSMSFLTGGFTRKNYSPEEIENLTHKRLTEMLLKIEGN